MRVGTWHRLSYLHLASKSRNQTTKIGHLCAAWKDRKCLCKWSWKFDRPIFVLKLMIPHLTSPKERMANQTCLEKKGGLNISLARADAQVSHFYHAPIKNDNSAKKLPPVLEGQDVVVTTEKLPPLPVLDTAAVNTDEHGDDEYVEISSAHFAHRNKVQHQSGSHFSSDSFLIVFLFVEH